MKGLKVTIEKQTKRVYNAGTTTEWDSSWGGNEINHSSTSKGYYTNEFDKYILKCEYVEENASFLISLKEAYKQTQELLLKFGARFNELPSELSSIKANVKVFEIMQDDESKMKDLFFIECPQEWAKKNKDNTFFIEIHSGIRGTYISGVLDFFGDVTIEDFSGKFHKYGYDTRGLSFENSEVKIPSEVLEAVEDKAIDTNKLDVRYSVKKEIPTTSDIKNKAATHNPFAGLADLLTK